MPPGLIFALHSIGVAAGLDEYQEIENLLGGSFQRLSELRSDPDIEHDVSELAGPELGTWLASLPVDRDVDVRVAWLADRIGARMTWSTFVDHVSDLWYPSMDDVVILADANRLLVLDHEERLTLSRLAFPSHRPETTAAPQAAP
ncbi:hypothetical protein [Pseudofrankia sp. BMG5.37]|uniref:hypothetical protein n=1 Tax=Pseudofrankia sp. BMG5.37 TaxID=3050035 RepID=UPI0028938503|nr:hypothetical protein [Pseudofrankia sp. BMG5.37]MDT3446776.1 hypothetical protein [Pseudofrankia sp. BMG5.37]